MTCCEEGTRLRSEYKNRSAEWVKAEGDLRNGPGSLAERFQRLKHAKREYRSAHSVYCDHLVLCEQCREATNGIRLRA
jgi:hypothetical protein